MNPSPGCQVKTSRNIVNYRLKPGDVIARRGSQARELVTWRSLLNYMEETFGWRRSKDAGVVLNFQHSNPDLSQREQPIGIE